MARNSTGTATTSSVTVTVTIGNDSRQDLYVTNEDGAGRITFTTDGTTATSGGDDMFYVPAAVGAFRKVEVTDVTKGDGTIDIKIIGSVSTLYSIQVDG